MVRDRGPVRTHGRSRLWMAMHAATSQVLDLLFPPRCAGCARPGAWFCASCQQQSVRFPVHLCWQCYRPLLPAGICSPFCPSVRSPMRGLAVYSALLERGPFDQAVHSPQREPLRQAIHAFKYVQQTWLAAPLGDLLAVTYRSWHLYADLLVPVPLSPARQAERGYNQSALLAERCAALVRVPAVPDLLVRCRETRPQVGLTAAERRQNVAGVFAATKRGMSYLPGRHVVLIDDVCTTGATLEEAAAVLRAAGAISVWGLTLARQMRHSPAMYVAANAAR
jgi:ComF family protein